MILAWPLLRLTRSVDTRLSLKIFLKNTKIKDCRELKQKETNWSLIGTRWEAILMIIIYFVFCIIVPILFFAKEQNCSNNIVPKEAEVVGFQYCIELHIVNKRFLLVVIISRLRGQTNASILLRLKLLKSETSKQLKSMHSPTTQVIETLIMVL